MVMGMDTNTSTNMKAAIMGMKMTIIKKYKKSMTIIIIIVSSIMETIIVIEIKKI